MITGTTRLLGIIGDPVAHSLSPVMHNAGFAALGLDMAYVPLHVAADDIPAALNGLVALGFRGANVTVPHKGAVLPFMDWLHDDARLVQAVNTIVVDDHHLHGYNTDIEGVRYALAQACGDTLVGQPALIVGAGGAARAVALALARMSMPLTIVNRTASTAQRLVDLIQTAAPAVPCRSLPLVDLTAATTAGQRLIVNATTLGMEGAGKVPAELVDTLTAGHVVFDVVYGHAETEFLRRARRSGAETVDGLAMLLGQAASAFELWTGQRAPLEAMRRVLVR